jgi:hypothetical protein
MSTLMNLIFPRRKNPKQVWDIEAENFAWIEFFGSMLGRSDNVGQDVEIIYEKMQNPGQFKRFLHNLSIGIRKRYGFPHYLASFVLRYYLFRKIPGVERLKTDTLLSSGAAKGLTAYVEGPLREQILRERDGEMPDRMSFLFGHTHKPFQRLKSCRGYREPVHFCNSGGWIVEGETTQRLHGVSLA